MSRTSLIGRTYDVHPSVAYACSVLSQLPERTGRSLEEWIELVERNGPARSEEVRSRRNWLRREHGLGGTTAWLIADASIGPSEGIDPEAYLAAAPGHVERLFDGEREALRPIHDALIECVRTVADDVKVCPSDGLVSLYRDHLIAEVAAPGIAWLDLGLALSGTTRRPSARLVETGGAMRGERITHRFSLGAVGEVDDEVVTWLQAAYELDVPD